MNEVITGWGLVFLAFVAWMIFQLIAYCMPPKKQEWVNYLDASDFHDGEPIDGELMCEADRNPVFTRQQMQEEWLRGWAVGRDEMHREMMNEPCHYCVNTFENGRAPEREL